MSETATLNRRIVLILAAGRSSRMGEPKLLLRWAGQTLLHRACGTALATGAKVFVALADEAPDLCEALPAPVQALKPPHWAQGMGSTLAGSVEILRQEGWLTTDSQLLVMTADQPSLGTAHLLELFSACSAYGAAASAPPEDSARCGTPAAFSSTWFARLAQLSGERGARDLLRAARTSGGLAVLPLPDCPDIDTPDDWQRFQAHYNDQPT